VTVVDSSAVIAVLREEPDATVYADALQRVEHPCMSAGTLLELGTVLLHKKGAASISELYRFLDLARIKVFPVTEAHARRAIDAYRLFGKCTRHRAQLNFGDCFAYSLAKDLDEPLLYKGSDFSQTDIQSAL
jgi:ribonuclease VapC